MKLRNASFTSSLTMLCIFRGVGVQGGASSNGFVSRDVLNTTLRLVSVDSPLHNFQIHILSYTSRPRTWRNPDILPTWNFYQLKLAISTYPYLWSLTSPSQVDELKWAYSVLDWSCFECVSEKLGEGVREMFRSWPELMLKNWWEKRNWSVTPGFILMPSCDITDFPELLLTKSKAINCFDFSLTCMDGGTKEQRFKRDETSSLLKCHL